MNAATRDLEQDHLNIIRLTDIMESMVDKGATNILHFETIVILISRYVHGFHFAKEEKIFFSTLENKGFTLDQGPVGVMLEEHKEGKELLKGMNAALELYKAGNVSALNEIYFYMNEYLELSRAHIGKENHILFRLADRSLTEKEQLALMSEFALIELTDYRPGQIQHYIQDIDELEKMYL